MLSMPSHFTIELLHYYGLSALDSSPVRAPSLAMAATRRLSLAGALPLDHLFPLTCGPLVRARHFAMATIARHDYFDLFIYDYLLYEL